MSVYQLPLRSEYGFLSPGFSVDVDGNVNITGQFKVNGLPISASTTSLSENILFSSLTQLGTLTSLNINGNLSVSNGLIQLNATSSLELSSTNSVTIQSGTNGMVNISSGTNGTITILSNSAGNMDNVIIGATTPQSARFTNVSISGTLTDDSNDPFIKSVAVTPGTIDNYDIGSITPRSGTFTTLTATTNIIFSPTSIGSINNINIGATTARTGRFTTLTGTDIFSLTSTTGTHTISSTTLSNSTSTGALVISGGVGIGSGVNIAGNITLGGVVIQSTTPTSANHVTNKQYVDARSIAISIAIS